MEEPFYTDLFMSEKGDYRGWKQPKDIISGEVKAGWLEEKKTYKHNKDPFSQLNKIGQNMN